MRKNDKIRDRVIGISFIIVFILFAFICGGIKNNYSIKGMVVKQEKDFIIVEDNAGLTWEYDTIESYTKGDEVKLYFFNNTTEENRQDDELKKVQKIEKKS